MSLNVYKIACISQGQLKGYEASIKTTQGTNRWCSKAGGRAQNQQQELNGDQTNEEYTCNEQTAEEY